MPTDKADDIAATDRKTIDDEAFDIFSSDIRLLVQVLKFGTLLDRPMLDGVATPERIGLNELRVLMSVAGEGRATGAYLSRLLSMPAMNVSRALSTMDQLGWLIEVPDEANRRRKPYSLSPEGWAALEGMTPEFQLVADFIFADLTAAERKALDRILRKMSVRTLQWEKNAAG